MTIKHLITAAPISLALALAACGADTAAVEGATESSEALANVAAPAGQQWSDVVSVTPEGGYAIGNPDAPIKLVEYGSVTCSHCAEFEQEAFEPLQQEFVNSGRVQFELRNFILNPFDIPITLLTRCSGPEAYFGLTGQTFENQQALMEPVIQLQESNPQALQSAMEQPVEQRFFALAEAMGAIEFFKQRGVSEDQARACLTDQQSVEALIAGTERASTEEDVTGTPSFFLNGNKLETNRWADVKASLMAAGAR